MEEFNIVLAGVGGQGILLASQILGVSAVKEGFNVRVSEIHGMAQRGGAVVSHVRIGEKAYGPTVLEGNADVILGFEPLEALRNIKYASDKTLIIVSKEIIVPTGFSPEPVQYPKFEEIIEKMKIFTEKIVVIDALALARKAGNTITRNIVLLGALAASNVLPVKNETIEETIKELVRPAYLEMNLKAFKLGYEAVKK
ncbi:indolepyruvate ferredoxin oxidoreductase subunit beta [Candidatus Bathyarchaeota archaeon]|nr:MAG: indolepyruvate ferredoxin oxidoreductase subunit beta [Candidatus Bathyarchaeota archaeon]